MPILKLGLEDRAERQRGEKTDFVILEDRVKDFTQLEVERIRAKARDFSLLDQKECDYVLYRWREWSTPEEVREWVAQAIANPTFALRLLEHLMSATIINGVKRVPFLNGPAIEKFIDLVKLRAAAVAVPAEKRSNSDLLNVSLLDKAIERKLEGKPYSEISADSDTI